MSFTSAILSPSFLNLKFLGLFAAGACASASESESCILRLAGGIAMCRLLQLASAACNLKGRLAQVPSEQVHVGRSSAPTLLGTLKSNSLKLCVRTETVF